MGGFLGSASTTLLAWRALAYSAKFPNRFFSPSDMNGQKARRGSRATAVFCPPH